MIVDGTDKIDETDKNNTDWKTSLTHEQYKWSNNKMLLSLVYTLEQESLEKTPADTDVRKTVTFIKEGARPFSTKTT